jgi:hypothetical protein
MIPDSERCSRQKKVPFSGLSEASCSSKESSCMLRQRRELPPTCVKASKSYGTLAGIYIIRRNKSLHPWFDYNNSQPRSMG